jgi:hypothetical protein
MGSCRLCETPPQRLYASAASANAHTPLRRPLLSMRGRSSSASAGLLLPCPCEFAGPLYGCMLRVYFTSARYGSTLRVSLFCLDMYIYIWPVARQLEHHQPIQSILCCAYKTICKFWVLALSKTPTRCGAPAALSYNRYRYLHEPSGAHP